MKSSNALVKKYKVRWEPGITPKRASTEIKLDNGIMVFGGKIEAERYQKVVESFPETWKDKAKTVDIRKDLNMPIDLKPDWSESLKKNRVYPLGKEHKAFIDAEFNRYHEQGKISWSNQATPFGFPVFVLCV